MNHVGLMGSKTVTFEDSMKRYKAPLSEALQSQCKNLMSFGNNQETSALDGYLGRIC